MARQQETQREGIVLDDGTWVDVGRDGRWHPSPGERTRAAVVLAVSIGVLAVLALLLSIGGDEDEDVDTAATTTTTTTEAEEVVATTTTTAPLDPASVGGEPPSVHCTGDDRSASPLRDKENTAVLVLNATSRTGHGAAMAKKIEALGYPTTVPGNGGRNRTSVFGYVDGYCAEAVRLASELGLGQATFEPAEVDRLPVPLGRARIVATVGADTT